ncbi:uncharacterized protein LOC112086743 [Eutrema salsugineum]|uniref:uncharacterized protein LOC112086743 n=1 Tax=Eutrema salsugineum TaxID=72664 RepID=UPI000CECFC84|nr:uncharacterized protein LOC112086743 [Eutrema salsugineum]
MSMKSAFFLLMAICMAGSMNAQPPQLPPPSPGMPQMPDVNKCFSTLMNIPGCFAEIAQSIMTGKVVSIGPACCKAYLEAETSCTQQFPVNPFFPPMLKEQCSKIAGPPTIL